MIKSIKTHKKIEPKIYAYIKPKEYDVNNPEIKVGYTEGDVYKRVQEQTHTAHVKADIKWFGPAIFDDNGEAFKDYALHNYYAKNKIERIPGTEWFYTDDVTSKKLYDDFKKDHGILEKLEVSEYKLREEQKEAVNRTKDFYNTGKTAEFLWNAKPRFGKTLTAYDFCKSIDAKTILILTNRPAIADSWYNDYEKFVGTKDGFYFVSNVSLFGKNKSRYPHVLSRQEFIEKQFREGELKHIDFISLEDLKGAKRFGGEYSKLDYVADIKWDVLILDEAHEGVDTDKSDFALSEITRAFTLHLSGTPFKALKNDKFDDDAIFNWTYFDEQTKKEKFETEHPGENNPYADMPKLTLYTYQMSSIVEEKVDLGVDIDGEQYAFAFDLNEFFLVKDNKFVHEEAVDSFLDALTTQSKYPFSTEELRKELKHTFWLLDRVNSAKCLEEKLKNHPVFKDYEIILAAGDGRSLPKEDDEDIDKFDEKKNEASLERVKDAIKKHDKTITLSVGQLTTGITIPEWTAVLMLSNIKSEALYVQAAFRAQNPCMFKNKEDGQYYRKENAYVFDFDPARTLKVYENFAKSTASDKDSTTESTKKYIKKLLNFLPVIGEDDDGEMIELDVEKVLSIPRKIYSREVVRHGFMSNFLFKNISNVFLNPALLGITSKIEPCKDTKIKDEPDEDKLKKLAIDENGDPVIEDETIVGQYTDKFGDKKYKIEEETQETISGIEVNTDDLAAKNREKDKVIQKIADTVNKTVSESNYIKEKGITKNKQENYKKKIEKHVRVAVDNKYKKLNSEIAKIEKKRDDEIKELKESAANINDIKAKEEEYAKEIEEQKENLKTELSKVADEEYENACKMIIKSEEVDEKKKEIKDATSIIKDHLRGFTRTIPSFLMAYGDNKTTLQNFDKYVDEDVFEEVTRNTKTGKFMTIKEFGILRDGGSYTDPANGDEVELEEGVFDEKVFDSSIKEFINKRINLANYFDESQTEDIFDYIPPQKTNQIFTPKKVVVDMVDMLETENPGCFDDDTSTFFDPYMKSGQFLTEVIKRLFRSEVMKAKYPNEKDRLLHIFEEQVYGCAPTKIIFAISLNYIVGFVNAETDYKINLNELKHNLIYLDTLPSAESGEWEKVIFEKFNDTSNRVNLKDYVKILVKEEI